MNRHYKKPIVRPEQAREWLDRYESGEALKTIAHHDRYDIRTVRRQISNAEGERDMRQARQTLLRSALEKHFNDITALAENILSRVKADMAFYPDSEESDLLLDGLKQHLPRSPLWKYLDWWNKGIKELEDQQLILEAGIAPLNEISKESSVPGRISVPDIASGEIIAEVKDTSNRSESGGADQYLKYK